MIMHFMDCASLKALIDIINSIDQFDANAECSGTDERELIQSAIAALLAALTLRAQEVTTQTARRFVGTKGQTGE